MKRNFLNNAGLLILNVGLSKWDPYNFLSWIFMATGALLEEEDFKVSFYARRGIKRLKN